MRIHRLVAPLLLAFSISAFAQYSIQKIVIHGGAPYTDSEVLAVSGLQPGQMMSHNSLGNAAQHLLDTGVFADAAIELTGTGLARTVQIELKPLPVSALARATFANFPWWTPAELDAALGKSVPFYRGGIPPAGNLPDSVSAALTSMLLEKGVHGTVSNGPAQPTNSHPQLTWHFHIDDPPIRLSGIHLHGEIPPAVVSMLQQLVSHAAGAPYNEAPGGIEDFVLLPLRDAGYVNAQLTNLTRTATAGGSGYTVDLTATVMPGELFHVSSMSWQPTPIYPQEAFAHDAALHVADVASYKGLLQTEQVIVNAYLHLGYLDAYVDAHAHTDDAAHTVGYALSITPGEIYHVKTVTPVNLPATAQQDFDRGWLLKPGTVYDPIYVQHFLTNNTALRNLAGYTAGFQAAADPQTHLVDLTINFIHAGGQ